MFVGTDLLVAGASPVVLLGTDLLAYGSVHLLGGVLAGTDLLLFARFVVVPALCVLRVLCGQFLPCAGECAFDVHDLQISRTLR